MTSLPGSPSQPGSRRRRRRGGTGTWLLVAVLLAVPIVGPLLVPVYARLDPDLGGIPFFFWFQFAMIPVAALFTTFAYRLVVKVEGHPDEVATRAERTARWEADRNGDQR